MHCDCVHFLTVFLVLERYRDVVGGYQGRVGVGELPSVPEKCQISQFQTFCLLVLTLWHRQVFATAHCEEKSSYCQVPGC